MTNELVYTKASQITSDKEKAKESKILGSLSVMGVVAGVMTAFTALQSTDLKEIFSSVVESVKNPLLAAGLIGLYAYMECVSNDKH